jgi:hypothetical protein
MIATGIPVTDSAANPVANCGFGNKATIAPADVPRLQTQLAAVREIVADGQWRTIDTLAALVESKTGHRATPQSVSARLRDLRKPHFGGLRVDRRRVPESNGLFEYRVLPREKPERKESQSWIP